MHNHDTIWDSGDKELRWSESKDGFLQLALHCSSCGKWLKWVPQKPFWLQKASPKPVSGDPLKAW